MKLDLSEGLDLIPKASSEIAGISGVVVQHTLIQNEQWWLRVGLNLGVPRQNGPMGGAALTASVASPR